MLASVVGIIFDLVELTVMGLDGGEKLGVGDQLFRSPPVPIKGHVFDEAHHHSSILGPFDKIEHILAIIEASHDDDVDLDIFHTHRQGKIEPMENLFESLRRSSRHELEFEWVKRVEGDIQMGESTSHEVCKVTGQGNAIGRDANLFKTIATKIRKGTNDVSQILSHRWLATRQSDLVDTLSNKELRHSLHLVGGQQLFRWGERHAFEGHAVEAPQVAPLCQRYAEVGVVPRVPVP